jgi:hypothetical protein
MEHALETNTNGRNITLIAALTSYTESSFYLRARILAEKSSRHVGPNHVSSLHGCVL